MNREEILLMVRECGMFVELAAEKDIAFLVKFFRRAYAAGAIDQREDCAQVCDAHASIEGIAQQCAAAIRARKETE